MKVLARIWVREGDDSALSDFPINSLVELVTGTTIVPRQHRKTSERGSGGSPPTHYTIWEILG